MSDTLEAGRSSAAVMGDAENGNIDRNGASPQSNAAGDDSGFLEERDAPWPATFERSISLLSSPIISTPQADLFTRSPKPGGTPLTGRRAQRGYLTPEAASLLAAQNRGENQEFEKGVHKVQSLDFKNKYNSLETPPIKPLLKTQKEISKKAMEAKAYRQKLLQQKQDEGKDSIQMSPGFAKEKQLQKRKEATAKSLEGKATFVQCVFNMANILMGVGLLGLPYVFRGSGWIGGIVCMLLLGFVCWRTSVLIGRELNGDPRPSSFFDDSPFKTPLPPGSCAEARMRPPIKSFPDIARATFGETGCFFLSVVLYFELFSCLCIFIVSIGDHLHTLFPAVSHDMHVIFVGAATVIPTVVLRTPRLLSYLSMVGTFSTIAVVLAVVFAATFEGDISGRVKDGSAVQKQERNLLEDTESYHTYWRASGLPLSLGLVAYCFSGHAIVPSIYSSMQRPQDFERMIDVSFLIVTIACFAVGFSGYYMFGDAVLDQVTLSLEMNSSAVFLMKILTWLIIMTSFSKYILTMYPLALGMEEIVAPSLTSDLLMRFASSIIKLVLTAVAVIVSIYFPSFNFLCALVGMVCTMSVSVIFPAAAHLKMFNNRLGLLEKFLDWSFVIVGIALAIIGTYATIRSGAGG